MVPLRRLAWMCRELAKQHVEEPDVPAAPDGADGYAEWVQIALILFRVELEKSLRETEDYLNEMPGVLAVFELDEAPHYSSFCRWEQEYRMRELRRLLRVCRRRDGVATPERAVPVGSYRSKRSSGGRLAGIFRRTESALHAARVTIRMNSSKGHHQRRRPPRRGVATYSQ